MWTLKEMFLRLLHALERSPAPRTYNGNPSAGAEPSGAEADYEQAKSAAQTEHVVKHTWRF